MHDSLKSSDFYFAQHFLNQMSSILTCDIFFSQTIITVEDNSV